MRWDHEAVLEAFGDLTGIRFRFVAEEMKRQAMRFAEHFTLQELELVVLWTKRQIAREAGGFSAVSLQWRIIMGTAYGDEFVRFQERLGLAEEEMKRTGWRPPYKLSQPAQTTPVATAPLPPEKAEKPAEGADVWEAGKRRFKEMQQQLFTRGDADAGS